jgi:hypothetical protein
MRSYILVVLILWATKLGTATFVPLGFQNLYAKTRNGNNTEQSYSLVTYNLLFLPTN